MERIDSIFIVYGFCLWNDEQTYAMEGYFEKKWTNKKILKKNGLVLLEFDTNPKWILGLEESYSAECGPRSLELGQNIESKSEWRETLRKFCIRNQIKFDEPEWIIAVSSEDVRDYRLEDSEYSD